MSFSFLVIGVVVVVHVFIIFFSVLFLLYVTATPRSSYSLA